MLKPVMKIICYGNLSIVLYFFVFVWVFVCFFQFANMSSIKVYSPLHLKKRWECVSAGEIIYAMVVSFPLEKRLVFTLQMKENLKVIELLYNNTTKIKTKLTRIFFPSNVGSLGS